MHEYPSHYLLIGADNIMYCWRKKYPFLNEVVMLTKILDFEKLWSNLIEYHYFSADIFRRDCPTAGYVFEIFSSIHSDFTRKWVFSLTNQLL